MAAAVVPGALACALAVLGLIATRWVDHLLRQTGRSELVQLDSSGVALVLVLSGLI